MYLLVPDEPHLGFMTVAVIFVTATLFGFASHAPGGLGVFDATMMVAFGNSTKKTCSPVCCYFACSITSFRSRSRCRSSERANFCTAAPRVARSAGGTPMTSVAGLVREKSDAT